MAMVKGRNTKVIGVRVPDTVDTKIKGLADKIGLSASEWCEAELIRAAEGKITQGLLLPPAESDFELN